MNSLDGALLPMPEASRRLAGPERPIGSSGVLRGYAALAIAMIGITVVALLYTIRAASAERLFLLPVVSEPIRASGQADPTAAWIRFCQRLPMECAVDVSQPARIALSPRVWTLITEVNERVNAAILPVTDLDHWGVIDRWDYPDDGIGDCEDIQLLKRRLLIEAGLPQRALRMTVVLDEEGAGHAVLMALTDRGDFILDNKRNAVLPWRNTGYTYLKREGTDSSAWIALGDHAAPLITANR